MTLKEILENDINYEGYGRYTLSEEVLEADLTQLIERAYKEGIEIGRYIEYEFLEDDFWQQHKAEFLGKE